MNEFSLLKAWIVAQREYLERVRTRSFVLSTFVTPFLMATFLVLPTIVSTTTARGVMRDESRPARVVIASDNVALADLARGELTRQRGTSYDASLTSPISMVVHEKLDQELDDGIIDGYVWLDATALKSRHAVFKTRRMADFVLQGRLSAALSYAFAAQQMVNQGRTPTEIASTLEPVVLTSVRAGNTAVIYNEIRGAVVVFILVFVMFFSLLSYGVMVMRSAMEEKSSRITEVLLCKASAMELMTGKILGTGSVGLTQIGVWFGIAAFGAYRSLYMRTAMTALDVGPILIFYFLLFYVLGYMLYSSIFAAVGAIFNSIDEAQQWNFVVILPLIAASALILPVATSSDSALSVGASMFPFCSPVLMFERMAVHQPPLWQIALSLSLLLATIAGAMFVSARIYRIGILMYGKRPTVREVARWLSHA